MNGYTKYSFVAVLLFSGTVFSGTTACGPAEKKSAAHRSPQLRDNGTYFEKEPCREANDSPIISKMHLHDEAFCSDGIAHLIIDAEDRDNDHLEYHISADGIEVERDWEASNAFYLSGFDPGRRYTVSVITGDGCATAIKKYALDGREICPAFSTVSFGAATTGVTPPRRNPDEPYIELPAGDGAAAASVL
jgi:hypothetical protein